MTTHITKTWFDGKNIVTQEIPEAEIYKRERALWELSRLGQEIEAQPEPAAFAGVKVWVGNQQVVQLLTQTELHYAANPWLLVELNALKCIAALKEITND